MNIQLYYQERGTGKPLILLHGNGEDGTYFEHQLEYFSDKYWVIAIDTRGHGKSPRGTKEFTIRQFAEDLYDFMEMHHIKNADILGFSDGGNIALIFALKYPEKVNHLILNGANLDGSGVKLTVQMPIVLGYKVANLFAKKSPKAKANAEMLGLMVNDPNIPVEELSKVKAKTLVIAGKKDMIKDSHTRYIAQHIPDAKLYIIDGDHFIANKNHEVFNQIVDQFLH